MSRRRRHRLKLKSLYVWHRWLGLAAALFVIVLAVTGLALNHTEALGLDERHVGSEWLLDHYGIRLPETVPAWRAGDHWISQWERRLYLDDRDLGEQGEGRLRGALYWNGMVLVALDDALLLFTPDGERIDVLAGAALPGPPTGLTADATGRPLLLTPGGAFAGDAELMGWEAAGDSAPPAPPPQQLPPTLRADIARQWRGRGLTLERVLLDLHSGRILGEAGVWLMDAAAVVLLFLALSGSGIWIVRGLRNRQRGHHPRPQRRK